MYKCNLYCMTKSVESFLFVDLIVVAADLFCWFFVGLCLRLKQIPYCQRWEFPAWKGWNELNGHNQWELPLQLEHSSDPMTLFLDETLLYHMLYSSRKEKVPMICFYVFFRFLPETACFHKKQSDWTAAVAQGSLAWNIDWKARKPELLAPERRWNGWRSFDDAAGNPRGSQGRDSGPCLDQNVVEASNELRSIPMAGLVTALVDLAANNISSYH